VSVVVPVWNAATTLDAQLDALASQTYDGPWELVLADNGSTDASLDRATFRLDDFPSARVIDASSRRGPGHARNQGARAAVGDLLLFADADDVVSPTWISAMVPAAEDVALVAGRVEVEELNEADCRAWYPAPPTDQPLRGHDFLPFASGSNCAVWRHVFEKLGGFDENRLTGEDVDFSWRAQLAGYRLGYASQAVVHRRLKTELREAAVQHFRWGQGYAALFRDYRSKGMPRPRPHHVALAWGWIVLAWPLLAPFRAGRGRWVRTAAERAGQAHGSLSERVLFL
jgi:GT2 family glycosyltransferase